MTMTPKATELVRNLAEKHEGIITPEIVLNEAKRKSSPLHDFFIWDDTEAGKRFREIQAAQLIRRVKVTIQSANDKTVRIRAYFNIHDEEAESARGYYVPIVDAMRKDDWKAQIIEQCKRDIATFKAKYAALAEANEIINAMESFTIENQ